ncbi:MAG: hypothetical protein IPG17_23245 [Sandaracinaceae bacterium]|nr:hypothetical protein [Sandaracinaceae bacterium]
MTEPEVNSPPVPVAWEALEDAFENNSPEVHSYLQLETGEVLRIVDGVADPSMHARVIADPIYLRIDPVSSREQYRWMERFIATVDDLDLRHNLLAAIDGKGAFRRFKDALMGHPVDRERWFTFRSERLRSCMEAWLTTHGITAAERPAWRTSNEPPPGWGDMPMPVVQAPTPAAGVANSDEPAQGQLAATLAALSPQEAEMVQAFAAFLISRRGQRPRGTDSSARPERAPADD